MNFNELILKRQSCRNFDATRPVEKEKIEKILNSAKTAAKNCLTKLKFKHKNL